VGKTYAMLNEGRRRRDRGRDVVVGIVETHGRQHTAAQLGDLEVIPRRTVEHRGTVLSDMDLDAVLARRPDVVLVDEYAHTNAPGGQHEKRWQDIETLLEAGIDVVSTVNIQHLESLNDVIADITGVRQQETVPDAVVRRADQIELVDMSPEALRRRLAHGNVYPAARIDAALTNFFRPGNLGALRELALLWLADRVDESLNAYRSDHDIDGAWETRERVVVGLSGAPGGDDVVRRAARIAGRVGGQLIGVHVASADGLSFDDSGAVARQRQLVESLGGTSHEIVGNDRARSLVAFAQAEKATQVVLGATRRSRWHELLHGSLVGTVGRLADDLDVHVIAASSPDEPAAARLRGRPQPRLGTPRVAAGWVLAGVGLPLLTWLMATFADDVALSTTLLVFLAAVLLMATVGGRWVAVCAAVAASLLVNWYFVEPRYTFTIAQPENAVSLVVFVAVALTVGFLVDHSARRAAEARRARAEAAALARGAASLAGDVHPIPALLDQIRHSFGVAEARFEVLVDGHPVTRGESGDGVVPSAAGAPSAIVDLAPDGEGRARRIVVSGRKLTADDRRVLRLLGEQLAMADDRRTLADEASAAAALAEIDAVKTALLRSVSHDLRTPLAAIKALVTGLVDQDVTWSDEQVREALLAVDGETDRLNRLVGNLLDAGRLQTGALAVHNRPNDPAEMVSAALDALGAEAGDVVVELPERLPDVDVDAALVERSLANVISNAVRHRGGDRLVLVRGDRVGDEVHLMVIDHGRGVPIEDRERVLAPFHRLGDSTSDGGVGLGLAIARGFVEGVGGELRLDDTPGGGLTVTMVLPVALRVAQDVGG
jgi:two-component system sensor histidine kinase KdpD